MDMNENRELQGLKERNLKDMKAFLVEDNVRKTKETGMNGHLKKPLSVEKMI